MTTETNHLKRLLSLRLIEIKYKDMNIETMQNQIYNMLIEFENDLSIIHKRLYEKPTIKFVKRIEITDFDTINKLIDLKLTRSQVADICDVSVDTVRNAIISKQRGRYVV